MKRRSFLNSVISFSGLAMIWPFLRCSSNGGTANSSKGFFSINKRDDHRWFITPTGKPFFSIGLNHIDPATLRYPENVHLWRDKYQGSTIKWIKESVAPNLKQWGFNTVGWVQEGTVRQWRHSRSFTNDEYKALDMPYCHLLPFTEMHKIIERAIKPF